MQADLFKCSFCSESYDLELHAPKILIPCSHCLCLRCLKNIFYVHSPERRKCPNCNSNLLATIYDPENFPCDPTILQLLQSRLRRNTENYTELDSQQTSTANQIDEVCYDHVRKKLKTGQEVDDELVKLQELIISQFTEMRKMIHTSQNGTIPSTGNQKKTTSKSTMTGISPDESELIIKEEDDDEHPLADIVNKIKGVFTEAQKALNGFSKASENQAAAQAVQGDNIQEEQIKIEAESPVNSNVYHGGGVALNILMTGDEMEEEFYQQEEEERMHKQFVQELKSQIMEMETESQLELDFSEIGVSDEIFINMCSEEFWNGIDKSKILYLEVNFSATTVSDKQFILFLLKIVSYMKHLTSIIFHIAETKISNESIRILSYQCLKNYQLKSFGLNCSETSIGYEGIRSLDDGLKSSIKTLENIELVLNSNYILEEKFLDILSALAKLKYLKLSFEDSHLSTETIPSVIFCLGSLTKNLESLDLNLNGIEIDDKGLEGFSDTVARMEKLKHFKLCLGESFISNEFLLVLFQSLSLLATRLEALELDLHSTKFSNAAFQQLIERVLNKMQNTEHLKLNLSATKITNVSLKNLELPANKLRSLSLNLSENKIHDSGLQSFKEKNNFRRIKSIDFQVGETDVTDDALQDFLNHVEKEWNAKETPSPLNEAPPPKEVLAVEKPQVEEEEEEDHSAEEELLPKSQTKKSKDEFDPERAVFSELKKELADHYSLKSKPSKLETARVTRLINNLEPKAFESILIKILTNSLSLSKVEVKDIEEWAKTIQSRFPFTLVINPQKSTKSVEKKQNNNNAGEAPKNNSKEKKQAKNSPERKKDELDQKKQNQKKGAEKKQENMNMSMSIEIKQTKNSSERKQSQGTTERKEDDIHEETKQTTRKKSADKKPEKMNIETKQAKSSSERKEDNAKDEKKQNHRKNSLGSERKEDLHASKEKKQNHRSADRKQDHDDDDDDDENHHSEASSKKDPQLSEFVLSFRWMKKYAEEISFREKVVEILNSMETRSFSVFYKKLLDWIRQLSKTYKAWKIPPKLKQTTSSLNWWYRWMKGDQEITNLWKNLPYLHNVSE